MSNPKSQDSNSFEQVERNLSVLGHKKIMMVSTLRFGCCYIKTAQMCNVGWGEGWGALKMIPLHRVQSVGFLEFAFLHFPAASVLLLIGIVRVQ